MASMLASLKSVDFYRRLKKDLQQELTETSLPGAALSVIATVMMLLLFTAEFSSYLTVTTESKVTLDHLESSKDDTLQINFNFTFPHLKCDYASVDATNFMGTHDAGISARVTKMRLDATGRVINKHEGSKQHNHAMDEVHEGPATSKVLTVANFEDEHHRHDVMIVNFYAPWCHWCKKLEPVWEKSAQQLQDSFRDQRLILAKVDCTSPDSETLCVKHRVDAFPTILVFRKDDTGTSLHESYHGERSVPAITGWAQHFLAGTKARVIDANSDGSIDSHHGVGCMISGLVHVQRAPGMILVQAASASHEFNWETMDVSHTVNHLSFGPFLSDKAWDILPRHVAASVGALDDRSFSSNVRVPTTHEHYIKVVRHDVTPAKTRVPVVSYGYVSHSNSVQRAGEVPTVRLNYDILPIVVAITHKKMAFYHFLTNLCAIIGGVFTVAGIIAGGVDKGLTSLRKKQQLGKLG